MLLAPLSLELDVNDDEPEDVGSVAGFSPEHPR
jgi:hypothetical protein